MATRCTETYPATYEFLGTMDDAQLARFRSTGEVRVPVRSLTAKQRAALDAWFTSFHGAFAGATQFDDYHIFLYKAGAKEDLSNVDTGFSLIHTHTAHLMFWVRKPGAEEARMDYVFAQM